MSFEIPKAGAEFQKKNFNKVALIDADRYKHVVVYQVYKELQNGKAYSRDLVRTVIDDYLYRDIFAAFDAKAYLFCFSAPSKKVFRNWVTQEKKYKDNRSGGADLYDYENKWEDMAYVFEYIHENYPTLIFDDLEADDLLSMLQHSTDTFIFSHDKDLKQVVGFHYDMGMRTLMYTTEDEGFEILVNQILLGDPTDSIPGLKGFGPKALDGFREECFHFDNKTLLYAAIGKFIDKYGILNGMDCFAEMWHLVSMRTSRGDYNKSKYHSAFKLIETLLSDGNNEPNGSVQDLQALS